MKKKVLLIFIVATLILGMSKAMSEVVPGSDNDPIVTKSYIDKAINQLKQEILGDNNKTTEDENTSTKSSVGFKVVDVKKGQVLTCNENTQIVLRSGEAQVISNHASGLSDLTIGKDIVVDESIEKNHLLLVPRTDGRGLKFNTQSIILISGEYQLK